MSNDYQTPEWTLDCQGKQDMDDVIVQLSTRFYPGRYQRNGWYSTIASIYLGSEQVAESQFEAPSEAEVKRLTERWAADAVGRVATAVRAAFAK